MNRKWIAAIAVTLILVSGFTVYESLHLLRKLPPANIIPSSQFLADWAQFQVEAKALDAEQAENAKLPQNVTFQQHKDQLMGHLKRIQDQIPLGYTFMDASKQFVKGGK